MSYNGHPSRNYWNVALWIGNDEGLYNLARECIRHSKGRKAAAEAFVEALVETGYQHRNRFGAVCTPDGAPFTVAAVQHGMRGLE